MTDFSDRRLYPRIDVVRAIFLQITPPGSGYGDEGPILKCETVDVSVRGLRLLVPEEVPIGSRLEIAIPEEGWIENLELSGMARWIQRAEDQNGYWLGLELHETDKETTEKWYEMVENMHDHSRWREIAR